MTDPWNDIRCDLLASLGDPRRVDDYYLPILRFLQGAKPASDERPLCVGISGPQGSGKSTLVAHAVHALARLGVSAAALSIDDFYLTREEQIAVAQRHPGNRYLEHRGYPGTHDIALGVATLTALQTPEPTHLRVPRYDKGAFDGRGDRAAETTWEVVRTPLDVILLEGWMLGFEPVPGASISDPDLHAPNAFLPSYAAWTAVLDAFVQFDTTDLDAIVTWRIDAERARRHETGSGLTDAEARDYIERFLPAYRLWVPGLRAKSPIQGPLLRIELGPDRLPRDGQKPAATGFPIR